MPENEFFYNKQKLYYTDAMKKKTSSKKPVVKKTVAKKAASKKIANFEPVKVSFAVACLAAISILWLAIIAVTTK